MTQQFERLKAAPAYQLISQTIEREIVSGRIKLGDRLPTESALATQFGVNRSTVREGIRLLEQTGLVRREGGKRLFASLPRAQDLASRVSRAMVMHEVSFRELWEAAMTLEPPAAAAAAERVTPEHLDALAANIARTEHALAAGQPLVVHDIEFHELVAQAAGNRVLLLAREPMSQLFYPSVGVLLARVPQAGQRLVIAHRRILDGLARHHRGDAETWMRKHIIDFKRGYVLTGLDMERPVEQLSA